MFNGSHFIKICTIDDMCYPGEKETKTLVEMNDKRLVCPKCKRQFSVKSYYFGIITCIWCGYQDNLLEGKPLPVGGVLNV